MFIQKTKTKKQIFTLKAQHHKCKIQLHVSKFTLKTINYTQSSLIPNPAFTKCRTGPLPPVQNHFIQHSQHFISKVSLNNLDATRFTANEQRNKHKSTLKGRFEI